MEFYKFKLEFGEAIMGPATKWVPEHFLWASVLLRALQDFMDRQPGSKAWFLDKTSNTHAPGGYEWICDLLDLDGAKDEIKKLVASDDIEAAYSKVCLNPVLWKLIRVKSGR